ncbi:MAG: caspase family protein [Pseudomonadota bacterium]
MKFLLVFVAFVLLPFGVTAQQRVALVVGNNAYEDVPVLEKAVADAEAIAAQLATLDFDVILATDVDRRTFNLKVSEMINRLEPGDTAFVFYAGHGVEIEGENYLLPVDILGSGGLSSDFVTSESIALSQLLDRIRRTGARTTLAILDACRDNPFPAVAGRSIGRPQGLGRIAAPEGTFVMFSAGAGQQALDALDRFDGSENSVFTRLLLPKLVEPGLELRQLIGQLRVEVRDLARSRDHAQFPAYYDELLGDFYFTSAASVPTVADSSVGVPLSLPRDLPALEDMGAVASSKTVSAAMDAVEIAAREVGASIFARVDYVAEAAALGLEAPEAEVLIFGEPQLEMAALSDNILSGLILPLKVLVFSHKGQTVIAYEYPEEIFDDLKLSRDQTYLDQMTALLDAIAQEAAL